MSFHSFVIFLSHFFCLDKLLNKLKFNSLNNGDTLNQHPKLSLDACLFLLFLAKTQFDTHRTK